jgi:hypothetical protein
MADDDCLIIPAAISDRTIRPVLRVGSKYYLKNPEPVEQVIRLMLVPKKGLEPPHPCEYMDLNHARLPIPPLRPVNEAPDKTPALCDRKYSSILKGLLNVSNPRASRCEIRHDCEQESDFLRFLIDAFFS